MAILTLRKLLSWPGSHDVPCCLRDLKERPLESPGCFGPISRVVASFGRSGAGAGAGAVAGAGAGAVAGAVAGAAQAKPHQKAGTFN